MMTDRQYKLSWKAVRNGRLYCAPACGGRCTWDAYKKAKADAEAMVKSLGAGWKTRVFENRGWHWFAEHQGFNLSLSALHTGYIAILAGQWVGYSTTPKASVMDAVRRARPSLEGLKRTIACIEHAGESL